MCSGLGHNGSIDHNAAGCILPQGDEEFARQCHDRDLLAAPTAVADTVEAPTPCSAHPDFERTLCGSPVTCDSRITIITGLMPAAANAILRSSTIVCDP